MFKVPVRRGTMKEMLKAVRDLEARGYDYVTQIKPVYKSGKFYEQSGRSFQGKHEFRTIGYVDNVSYECWMKKVN
ncbi:hypothetical protein [Bacillus toyonensis]|uniref:hypothetical protein n=1 Tax=Bacillus toyonensis TaxID=155322 RepID=UPI000BF12733|nr:hypothetical protein [Bacillus toyonensis]PEO30879.1 hypothetical protein CN589_07735 [Bacillus toyonensis]